MSRDALLLHHVLDAIERIEQYVEVGHETFMATPHWQDATIRQLGIVGEAVKKLSPATIQRKPEIPWKAIAGMRDVLIHNYMGVDLEAVWEVTQQHLEPLGEAVKDLLRSETADPPESG